MQNIFILHSCVEGLSFHWLSDMKRVAVNIAKQVFVDAKEKY